MIRKCLLLALSAFSLSNFVSAGPTPNDPVDLTALVNPFIGTGGHGHTFPGATVPFGMVQLSPDTRLTGWDGCSGYHDSDTIVYGFSHTHLSGTGVSDYGDILFMPVVGLVQMANGYHGETKPADPDSGYASRFRKETEQAQPGYYSVHLDDSDIDVELTATARTGLHRYSFPASAESHVIVDLSHRDMVLEAEFQYVNEYEIAGMRRSNAWATDQLVYFVARFSKPIQEFGLFVDGNWRRGPRTVSGSDIRAYLRFPSETDQQVSVQVGLSSVDYEGARKNLEAELTLDDFDGAREQARDTWQAALSKIEVEGGTDEQRRVFYSALYHTMIAPNLFSDVDGRVRGMDGKIHAPGHDVYTVFSLWDTFRAAHPLFTLIEEKRTNDFLKTFIHQFRTGGKLPIWELAGNYTGCMIGYHSIPVIADAYLKGIRDYDANALFDAMLVSADADVLGLDAYKARGFIPADHESESVSKTLEYGYDDWCIARMGEALGRTKVAARFDARAQSYKNLFDPTTGFLRPRRNGGWVEPFDPREVNFNFTEANAWQYSLFVPHDLDGLTGLLGGDKNFVERLDAMFSATSSTTGRDQADITGLIGQYAHGNEPSHHVAYLYNFAGQAWKTQGKVHQILNELYSNTPDGLSGNEDCGQMSAWYVLSALGFYPVCPGSNEYVIGTPLFDRATINFEDGKRFVLEAERDKPGDFYIQSTALNGEPHADGFLRHADLVSGGEFKFELGSEPNEEWASAEANRPSSKMSAESILAVPFIRSGGQVFRENVSVTMGHVDRVLALHYTLDGTDPDVNSPRYEGALILDESKELRAIAIGSNNQTSAVVSAHFHKLGHDWTIELGTEYSPQYAAGGSNALIDGLRGAPDFRTGAWQGWWEQDLIATIDMKRTQPLQVLDAGFLQDTRSWIWMPTQLEIYTSVTGEDFTLAATVENEIALDDETGVHQLSAKLGGVEARYVRIVARTLGIIPDWHIGRGNPTWIFADEVTIE
ncbi:MAG: putative alpha-1,2-mannosidase [Planctomycetota bacterium]|jgi:predicted alpha-1,2-mannosidase